MKPSAPAERWGALLALALGLLPLLASAPYLDAPLGQSEPSLSLSIWGLGARALLERGPIEAKLGAVVAPYPGRGDGIYAHHPPLPVWVSVPLTATGAAPFVHRLAAVGLALLTLWLLFRLLRGELDQKSSLESGVSISSSPRALCRITENIVPQKIPTAMTGPRHPKNERKETTKLSVTSMIAPLRFSGYFQSVASHPGQLQPANARG